MDKTLQRVHFAPTYFLDPVHPISVTLVGAGGNGSRMLSCLARINASLLALGRKGLSVTVYDADTVEQPNIGRQLFSPSELGMNKAVALVSRFNRFYGTGWRAKPRFFTKNDKCGNIVISCVDSVKARLVVDKAFENCKRTSRCHEDSCFYWMDLGNAQTTGQCFIGSIEISQPSSENCLAVSLLPTISAEIDLSSVNEEESGPSCSMAEALQKQDLFINSTLCELAGSLLWSLFKDNSLEYRGFYINLETMRVVPVGV